MERDSSHAKMPCNGAIPRVGYAFVPVQVASEYYDHESAFICGTIFPELCIPKGKYGPNEDAPRSGGNG